MSKKDAFEYYKSLKDLSVYRKSVYCPQCKAPPGEQCRGRIWGPEGHAKRRIVLLIKEYKTNAEQEKRRENP